MSISSGMHRSIAPLVLLLATSCSSEVSATAARERADEYVRREFNVTDLSQLDVQTAERDNDWLITYSAKGEALGGPLVIGINKQTGHARLVEGYQ